MKKIALLLGFLTLTTSCAFAKCEYTCVSPYDTSGHFKHFIGTITGVNFTKKQIAQSIIKKEIAKDIKGKKLKVKLEPVKGGNLSNGIFKSLTVSGKDVVADEIHLSSLDVKTLCDFNYIKFDKKGNLFFKEDFPMEYNITMSADDINNSLESEKYKKIINNVNKILFTGAKIDSTKVEIRANKFYYIIYIDVPFVKDKKKLIITTDVAVDEGKIKFKNSRLTSNSSKLSLSKLDYLLNYLNPLDFSANITNNKKAKINIKNFKIKNNIINIDGVIVVPKD